MPKATGAKTTRPIGDVSTPNATTGITPGHKEPQQNRVKAMTSTATEILNQSPQQAHPTQSLRAPANPSGLRASGQAAWIERFAQQAVGHMAASGVMTLKHALEYLLDEDSKPEPEARG
jgi:hypothetical protein